MEQVVITPIDNSTILLESFNGDVEFIEKNKTKKELFDTFSKSQIKEIKHFKKKDILKIIIEDKCALIIKEYSQIKRKSYFQSLKDVIRKYNLNVLLNKVSQKVDPSKLVCVGSLVTAMTIVSVGAKGTQIFLQDQKDYMQSNTQSSGDESIDLNSVEDDFIELEFDFDNEFDDEFYEEKWKDDMSFGQALSMNEINEEVPEEILNIENLNNPEPINESIDNSKEDTQISIPEENLELNKTIEYITNDNNLVNEPPILEKIESEQFTNDIQKNDSAETIKFNEIKTFEPNANEPVDFNDLKYITNYDDYIKFAANLFYVDYETAKKVVEEKMATFNTPSENVSEVSTTELNRIKDLKERGIINGDMNVIGIFISIKDYAIDYLNLSKQTPIISSKTNEEREHDLIDVAKYIYGIDNMDMLNTIIAIHRTETKDCSIATEKNNLGGIINPSSSYENPVPNIYKTTEIGAESAIRNFMMVFDKCIYNNTNPQAITISEFMCETYCPHSPETWKNVVSSKIINENIQEGIESYLNSNTRTY